MSNRHPVMELEMKHKSTYTSKNTSTSPEDDYLAYYPTCVQSNGRWLCPLTWVVLFIGVLLMLILIPLSYSYVEYDAWAFKKNELSNEVDLNTVYSNGQYHWGPSFDALNFPRGYQREELNLSIFPQNGLEFDIDIVFFWRIQPLKLKELFQQFGQSYRSQIESRANAKIKNRAPDFTVEQYIQERPLITEQLHLALKQELDLIFIDVPADKFFLLNVNLPQTVRTRDLDTAVREQQNLEEQNKQLVEIVKKETQRLEELVQANVTITSLRSTSRAENIILEAYAIGNRTVTDADSGGSSGFFSTLNITNAASKSSYIRYFRFAESINL